MCSNGSWKMVFGMMQEPMCHVTHCMYNVQHVNLSALTCPYGFRVGLELRKPRTKGADRTDRCDVCCHFP